MGLEVQHPDEFLLNQLDLEPDLTIATLRRQATATRRPAITTEGAARPPRQVRRPGLRFGSCWPTMA